MGPSSRPWMTLAPAPSGVQSRDGQLQGEGPGFRREYRGREAGSLGLSVDSAGFVGRSNSGGGPPKKQVQTPSRWTSPLCGRATHGTGTECRPVPRPASMINME